MKHSCGILLAAGLLFAAAGCATKTPQPELSLIKTDTLLPCNGIRCDVKYRFTTIANADADPALKAIEEANIEHFFGLEGFTGTAQEAITASLAKLQKETDPSEQLANGREPWDNYEDRSSEARVVDTLLVYTITLSDYTGGAHGMFGTSAHNYSLAGGYELTLGDIFTTEQQNALGALIHRKLFTQYHAADDKGLESLGFFPETIGVSENFAVSPEGITFYYNPYEIACFAVGEVKVFVPNEELPHL